MTPPDDRGVSIVHRAALEAMKDQLLIVLVERLGGRVDVPCAEIDATGDRLLALSLDQATRVFTFEIQRKQ